MTGLCAAFFVFMLFTDSDIIDLAALLQIDGEVAAVAATTKPAIKVDGPGSICEQAWGECGRKITTAQQMYTSYLLASGMSGGGGIAAVMNTGQQQARNQARARLNQIVATESQYANSSSAVQIWMAYTALSMFYRDASARMGKDRLEEKYLRHVKDADFAWRQLRQVGLPFLSRPLEAPGARHGFNAGTWGAANLSTVAGGGTAQTLQVAITYYDDTRYISEANAGNGESGPSEILSIAQALGTVLHVSIASLNPPTGAMPNMGLSQGPYTPLQATHWILWAGQPGGALHLQTVTQIAIKTVTLAGDPDLAGEVLGAGQVPELYLHFANVVGRG